MLLPGGVAHACWCTNCRGAGPCAAHRPRSWGRREGGGAHLRGAAATWRAQKPPNLQCNRLQAATGGRAACRAADGEEQPAANTCAAWRASRRLDVPPGCFCKSGRAPGAPAPRPTAARAWAPPLLSPVIQFRAVGCGRQLVGQPGGHCLQPSSWPVDPLPVNTLVETWHHHPRARPPDLPAPPPLMLPSANWASGRAGPAREGAGARGHAGPGGTRSRRHTALASCWFSAGGAGPGQVLCTWCNCGRQQQARCKNATDGMAVYCT